MTKLIRGGGAAGLNICEAWHRAENDITTGEVTNAEQLPLLYRANLPSLTRMLEGIRRA